MRTLEANKQKMYYSLYAQSSTVYAKDKDGNLIIDGYYDDEETEPIYREIGTNKAHYSEPVEFKSSISGNLSEIHAKEYGVDQSSIYAEISCSKGYLPLEYGSKIWKDTPITWEDETNKIPNKDSADYTVVGLLTEFRNYDFYLLRRNNIKTV